MKWYLVFIAASRKRNIHTLLPAAANWLYIVKIFLLKSNEKSKLVVSNNNVFNIINVVVDYQYNWKSRGRKRQERKENVCSSIGSLVQRKASLLLFVLIGITAVHNSNQSMIYCVYQEGIGLDFVKKWRYLYCYKKISMIF